MKQLPQVVQLVSARAGPKAVPQFQPVSTQPWDRPPAQPNVCFWGKHSFYINAGAGEAIGVTLTHRSITYRSVRTDTALNCVLLDTDGNTVLSQNIPVGERQRLSAKARKAGSYRLTVDADSSGFEIEVDNRYVMVEAPVHLFKSRATLYFRVPEDISRFAMLLEGAGGDDYAGVDVFDGNGTNVASGQTSGPRARLRLDIDVPRKVAGKAWCATLWDAAPGQYEDALLNFGPENCFGPGMPPYFALDRERLMEDKELSIVEMDTRYKDILDRFRDRLDKISCESSVREYWQKKLGTRLARLRDLSHSCRRNSKQTHVQNEVAAFDSLLAAHELGRLTSTNAVLYQVKSITNRRILPDTEPIIGTIADTLTVVAAPGEYEPASVVVRAEKDIRNLRLEVTDLKAPDNRTLAAACVDIRVVKAWYQDRGRGYQEETPARSYSPCGYSGDKVLVPELLLKDDSLIKVDTKARENYIKLKHRRGPSGGREEYVCISSAEGVPHANKIEFPVKDSDVLLPVDIPAETNKQFWITVHVPETALAGLYEGTLRLISDAGPEGVLALRVKILPFQLCKPYYYSGIYYYEPAKGFYGDRTLQQFKLEMENMVAHGIFDVMCPFHISDTEAFEIRKTVGLCNKILFYRGWKPNNPTDPEALKEVKARVKETIAFVKQYGVEDVYFYGMDEAKGEQLTSQIPAWQAVHDAGGKIFVAGYKGTPTSPGNFALMGDIQDLFVCAGYPSREEARQWHSKGHKIVCYCNPQSGVEAPETYRRNYGLLCWQYDYDGAMTYIYHWGAAQDWVAKPGTKRHLPCAWNDFCRKDYKQHNMVYPTSDGVVDTLQWEGYREGVDDVRYVTTLLEAIRQTETSGKPSARAAVRKARAYITELKSRDVNVANCDLDAVRQQIIAHILNVLGIDGSEHEGGCAEGKLRKTLGYVMLVVACLSWIAIPLLSFSGISLAAAAAFTTGLIITGEVTFFVGIVLLGKEAWKRIKAAFGISTQKNAEYGPTK